MRAVLITSKEPSGPLFSDFGMPFNSASASRGEHSVCWRNLYFMIPGGKRTGFVSEGSWRRVHVG